MTDHRQQDNTPKRGFFISVPLVLVIMIILGALALVGLVGENRSRQPNGEPPTAPERIVPPQGQTGEVAPSQSPVQR